MVYEFAYDREQVVDLVGRGADQELALRRRMVKAASSAHEEAFEMLYAIFRATAVGFR